ncbi:TVP38/TMEM64 family protein [Roseospira marina]|uniref:TVP38/TMEM64 family protein n=1 Tax=Roseospira marina TaxID=140057 RepID=A0A5M6IFG7_9PROT|nr:VTT domain-containing protein [Roseospira marina]KAA5606677.1 TVP38/TMEM64 family protein [Roseospira marina]MBB4313912.1 putative membrane protein YdjX (TVP38/TMEM64 family) [Roseospira marina]MBB5087074.1 putative membrane protein YdjX (TVP38/TMEM64 family) [Roseospira marina]
MSQESVHTSVDTEPRDGTAPPDAPAGTGTGRGRSLARLLIALGFAAGFVGFLALGGDLSQTFETLAANHAAVSCWVDTHKGLAALAFATAYVLVVAFSVPGAVWMSIVGGYLFGTVAATALIVVSATLGATVIFLAARFVFGDAWRDSLRGSIARLQQGLRENAFSSLLVLRLIPLFPFWLVNLVPAFVGVPMGTFIAATALGIIPGAAVYAGVGNGLDAVFAAGEVPDLGVIYDTAVFAPLLGLAALAMLPTAYRLWKGRGP